MKISVPASVLAALFSAVPAFAGGWAPEVSLATLSAIEIPAPALAAKAGPRDGQNYSGAEELLIKEFGVDEIGMDVPEAEVMRQTTYYSNSFCFEHALRQALTALLEDYSNPTSPLAKELAKIGVMAAPSKSELKKARQRLLEAMNRREAFISIVSPYKQFQPQNGETVEANWVFFLRLDGSAYWAIVDRSGEKAPYVYGMN